MAKPAETDPAEGRRAAAGTVGANGFDRPRCLPARAKWPFVHAGGEPVGTRPARRRRGAEWMW
jgi:hypothetical protein